MSCLAPYIRKDEDPNEILKLDELIAEGSFGTVYKGSHAVSGVVMAIKIIQLEEDETFDDLVIEIEIMSKCHHENIVSYLGAWRKNDELFIAMEWCDGGSAADIYQDLEKHLDEPEIAIICRETLKGLQYMHSLGYLHRDVKGANILIKTDGAVKLVDFGVSGRISASTPARRTFIGTPYWMAPEVIENKSVPSPYDYKADVWSLGITLLELAQAEPPLSELHPMKALFQIPYRNPPTLAKPAQWSPMFADFLSKCLQKDPKQRMSIQQLLGHPFIIAAPVSPQILIVLVQKYLIAKKAKEAAEEQEAMEEQTDEERSAAELLAKVEKQKKLVKATDKSHAQVEAVKADLPPAEFDIPPPLAPPPAHVIAATGGGVPVIPPPPLPAVAVIPPPPVGPATPGRAQSAVSPDKSKKLPAGSAIPPPPPPAAALAVTSVPPAASSPAIPGSPVAKSDKSKQSTPAATPRPAASIAQQRRPKTVHRGTARRTAEIKKNINRKLLRQQLAEIKALTKQHQKDLDLIVARQNEQKAKIARFFAEKTIADQRKRTREEEQIAKKLAADREAEQKKFRVETELATRQQANTMKTWARDFAGQQRGQQKIFEDQAAQRTREQKEEEKQREREMSKTATAKKLREHLKNEQKTLRLQEEAQASLAFHHQLEMQRLCDEHIQQLHLKDEALALALEQRGQHHVTETAALVAQQTRQIETARAEHQLALEGQSKLADYETEALKQVHNLQRDQLQRRIALELEQHKRQQQVESRDRSKELRQTQKKKLDEFTERQKDELKAAADKKAAKQEQREKRDDFMRSIQVEEAQYHKDAKSRMDEEDELLKRNHDEQLRGLAESQAAELHALGQQHASAQEMLKTEQRRQFEELEVRHCKELTALTLQEQQEMQALRVQLQDARRQARAEWQKQEAQALQERQAAAMALLVQHHQQQADLLRALHTIQQQVRAKDKKTPPADPAMVTAAQEKDAEKQKAEHDATQHALAEKHAVQRASLTQTHQRQSQEDADRDNRALQDLQVTNEAALNKLRAEVAAKMSKHTIVTAAIDIPSTPPPPSAVSSPLLPARPGSGSGPSLPPPSPAAAAAAVAAAQKRGSGLIPPNTPISASSPVPLPPPPV